MFSAQGVVGVYRNAVKTEARKISGKGEPFSRSPSNLAASAIDKCVPIQSEEVDEPVNASRVVGPVHRPSDAIDIAGCCVVDPGRGRHDVPRSFLAPNGYAG